MLYSTLKQFGESYLDRQNQSNDTTKQPSFSTIQLKSTNTDNNNNSFTKGKLAKTLVMFLAGAGAGIASTASTYPFDIMRTQFAVQGKSQMFPTIHSFVTHTFKTKGIPGMYKYVFIYSLQRVSQISHVMRLY